jgi:hypothetical protein
MTDFEKTSVMVALRKMFRPDSYLNICAIEQCLEIARIAPSREQMVPLKAMHCVHWSEMPVGFPRQTAQYILDLFGLDPFTVDDLDNPLLAPPKPAKPAGLFGRLLGDTAN